MLALSYPKEFWLRVTNSVLGSLLVLLVVLVAVGLILDVIRRARKRIKPTPTTPSGDAKVGTTLADGGEKLDLQDSSPSEKPEHPET